MATIPEQLIRPSMPELDSLRGIAILSVLFFHGFGFQFGEAELPRFAHLFVLATMPGWLGVNLFFVLSGFLITGILLDSKSMPGYFRRFYTRRALRILPAYYALLLVLSLLPFTGWFEHRQVSWQFVGLSFVYLSNVTPLFAVPAQYGALWSLAVEEHFYLLWPALVRWMSPRTIGYIALGILAACPLLRALAYRLGFQYGAGYTWLVADGLAAGSLLGLLSRSWLADRKRMTWVSVVCMAVGMALLAIGAPYGILRGTTFVGGVFRLSVLNLFFTGVLGTTLVLGTSNLRWIVLWPSLRFFGYISYGLYLIHMLAFDFTDHLIAQYFPDPMAAVRSSFSLMCLRFVVAGSLAIGVAKLSREYFEEPFLRLKDRSFSSDAVSLPQAAA
jgi:peptidoglycan/LPS O-acetylase OafA/YrhL